MKNSDTTIADLELKIDRLKCYLEAIYRRTTYYSTHRERFANRTAFFALNPEAANAPRKKRKNKGRQNTRQLQKKTLPRVWRPV